MRPARWDYGSGLSAALFVAFPMLQAGLSNHRLWQNSGFMGGFIAVAIMGLAGLAVFFWHWRWRVVPPFLILIVYGLVTFSAPSWGVLLALGVATLVTGFLMSPDRIPRAAVTADSPNADTHDDSQFARFFAQILEIQFPSPPTAPDLFFVIVLQIGNNGAPSACSGFRASATTTYGAALEVEVVSNNGFRLYVNGARDCYTYLPEHFIMNRVRLEEVRRGKPVDGILPVVVKGITNPKEVNWLSLNIEFCDGIGDEKGRQRWWRVLPMDATKWKEVETTRFRPGLPSLESPCSVPLGFPG